MTVFFENNRCVKCGSTLGFLPDIMDMGTLKPVNEELWRLASAENMEATYRLCANGRQQQICNWMVPVSESEPFCQSCRLNDTIPDLTVSGNKERWYKLELAKRRCLYTLFRLGLPMAKNGETGSQLRFCFLGERAGDPPIITGHSAGRITINIAEADEDERERRRLRLHEEYRTLVGHFRHELGHYYWDLLVANTPDLGHFRELFGDETRDYDEALQKYYREGAPSDWPAHTVTAYASAHSWEDWAETWAHYLHIVETTETAAAHGISLNATDASIEIMRFRSSKMPGYGINFEDLIKNWIPLTTALNSVNRGMGLPDLYPFVISPLVIEKLRFVHKIIQHATEVRSVSDESDITQDAAESNLVTLSADGHS